VRNVAEHFQSPANGNKLSTFRALTSGRFFTLFNEIVRTERSLISSASSLPGAGLMDGALKGGGRLTKFIHLSAKNAADKQRETFLSAD